MTNKNSRNNNNIILKQNDNTVVDSNDVWGNHNDFSTFRLHPTIDDVLHREEP